MNTSPSTDSPPALWNPNAAACWSLIFSPAFGAFLHERNARNLGRTHEAKANRVWFYSSLAYLGLVLICIFIPAIPNVVYNSAALGILLGWYFSLGKKQIQYVNSQLHNGYTRKPWSKPLLVAFDCFVGFMVLATILSVAAATMYGIE